MDDSADNDQTRVASGDAEGRESGIVEVERKAGAVTGGVTGAAVSLPTSTNEITGTRESVPGSLFRGEAVRGEAVRGEAVRGDARSNEIEIETDLAESSRVDAPRAQMITQTNERGSVPIESSASLNGASEDDAIAVSDDEIESAEPARPTLTSGLPAFSVRSRPPERPSQRPRPSLPPRSSLPPPRSLLGSSLPPPSFPSQFPSERLPSSERDPWILANKTLELSRANARITALEDQIAFRDARILTLEERLESAQQKVAELEAKLELAPAARPAQKPGASAAGLVSSAAPSKASTLSGPAPFAKPATSTKQVSIPKPADVSKPPSSRQPISAAAAAVFAAGPSSSPMTQSSSRSEATPAAPRVAGVAAAGTAGNSAANSANTSANNGANVAGAASGTSAAANGAAAFKDAGAANGSSAKANQGTQTPEPPEASESIPPPALVAELQASRAPNGPEDLQRIAGIGPRFEAALRKQGITRVSQIASWSEADIKLVAKALKIPKSRIVKGRWVETARELSK